MMTSASKSTDQKAERRPQLPFLAEIRALQLIAGGREGSQPPSSTSHRVESNRSSHQSHSRQSPPRPTTLLSASVPLPPPKTVGTTAPPVEPSSKLPLDRPISKAAQSQHQETAATTSRTTADKTRRSTAAGAGGGSKSVQFEIPDDENRTTKPSLSVAEPLSAEEEKTLVLTEASPPTEHRRTSSQTRTLVAGRKGGNVGLKLTAKSNMSSLADMILPQLNEMQKNYLGQELDYLKVSFYLHYLHFIYSSYIPS